VGSEARIVELLVEKYGVEEDRISPDAAMTDLGLDSLSVAELVFDIEDLFEIELREDDSEFTSFGQAVALVDRYLEAKGT
jgi:acyl carrier protein